MKGVKAKPGTRAKKVGFSVRPKGSKRSKKVWFLARR